MLNFLQCFEHLIVMDYLNHACVLFRNCNTSFWLEYSYSENVISFFILFLYQLNSYNFSSLVVLKDDLPVALNEILVSLCWSMIVFNLFCGVFARNYSITAIRSNYCQFNIFMSLWCLNKRFFETDCTRIIIINDSDCTFYIISTQCIFVWWIV